MRRFPNIKWDLIVIDEAHNLRNVFHVSKDETTNKYIDPYYSLVGYFNSIRELGGAVRLLQDDIPKRIKRLKKKYHYERERPLKRRTEITSRMSSYDIPNKLKQLETTFQSDDCLDTAVATNMIAVGMDVDRLGLMVVTGQPKQNSEYIQATSRIGRSFPGLVVTLYNPYRPRDLSHFENFTGYHSQLYRFVEGTTATPFSARARDRVLHAVIISAIRLKYPDLARNTGAGPIASLNDKRYPGHPDIVLPKYRVCIFVNGCFWHHHDPCKYFVWPKSNAEFWKNKIDGNVKRDVSNYEQLKSMGWNTIVIWECELKPERRQETLTRLVATIHTYL